MKVKIFTDYYLANTLVQKSKSHEQEINEFLESGIKVIHVTQSENSREGEGFLTISVWYE